MKTVEVSIFATILAGYDSFVVIQPTFVFVKSIAFSTTVKVREFEIPDGLYFALNSMFCPTRDSFWIKIFADMRCLQTESVPCCSKTVTIGFCENHSVPTAVALLIDS